MQPSDFVRHTADPLLLSLSSPSLKLNTNTRSEEEHSLIAQYSQILGGMNGHSIQQSSAVTGADHGNEYTAYNLPQSPSEMMAALDMEQRDELEAIIQELEEENR
jgi:hypothetical protein